MSIKASIRHLTHYRYDRPVSLSPQVIRLQPGAAQPHAGDLAFAEGLAGQAFREPPAGPLRQLAGALRLPRAGARVEDRGRPRRGHDGLQPVRLLRRGERGDWPFDYPSDLKPTICRSTARRARRAAADAFLQSVPDERMRTVDFIVGLNARLSQEIGYVIRMEPGVQTPEETLERPPAPAATPAGCWCRSCAIWASRRASSRAI
jgi:transglutaminase-like putative cysteine protease